MKKAFLFILLIISVFCFADDKVKTKSSGVLFYYQGGYDGKKIMPISYLILSYENTLRTRRNEIWAKYGRPFKDKELRQYFQSTDWYQVNPYFHVGLLTETDLENIARIRAFEKETGDAVRLKALLQNSRAFTNGQVTLTLDDNYLQIKGKVRFSDGKLQEVKASQHLQAYGVDGWIVFNETLYLLEEVEASRWGVIYNLFEIKLDFEKQKILEVTQETVSD